MPQRPPKARPQARHSSSQQQPASTPPPAISASISVHMSSPRSSPPPSSPDVNSLDGLPLTTLPAPARPGIVLPPRTLSHLQTSFTPPDDSRTQEMQRQAIRQGFCCEEPATGAHGLLANPLAAAEPPSLADSGVSATTSFDPGPSLQHSDMDHNLDVSWASWTRMRKGYVTMKSSFPRLHLQLHTRTYGPPARTNTQTYLCSSSSSPSARLLTHESGSRP